jgi:hypothetical protein
MNKLQISGVLDSYGIPPKYKELIFVKISSLEDTIGYQSNLLNELEEMLRNLQTSGVDVHCPICGDKLEDCIFCEKCHWGFV